MNESTRALLYRLAVVAVIVYVVIARPESLGDLVPVILALLGNGLASLNTRIKP